MNMNNFGHVYIFFEYDTMCARVYRVRCFNFSNIHIRTDFYIKIRIRRMRILINSVTSLIISPLCLMHILCYIHWFVQSCILTGCFQTIALLVYELLIRQFCYCSLTLNLSSTLGSFVTVCEMRLNSDLMFVYQVCNAFRMTLTTELPGKITTVVLNCS